MPVAPSPPASPVPAGDETAPALLESYREVRGFTERLAAPLESEDCVVQSMPDVSPTKWHLAHTSWFFETFILATHQTGYRSPHPQYGYLFNSYYNAVGERHCRPRRGLISRPTLAETFAYRAHVDRAMQGLLCSAGEELLARVAPLVTLGLHHEQQHQELIGTDIKHVLSCNPLRPSYHRATPRVLGTGYGVQEVRRTPCTPYPVPRTLPPAGWVEFPEGVHWIGHEGGGFAFDNEGPRHRALVLPFALASRPVTNAEFLRFIEDGGYQRPEFWLSAGWATVQAEDWRAPLYWEERPDGWWTFTLAGMRPIALGEPVAHVSYFEADAYARWAGARLPTEFEWEVAARMVPVSGHFADPGRLHPAPVEAGHGLSGMFGDVWEWTRSSYAPYPGYAPDPGALGEYNGKFMCNQYVLRGGSCATPAGHIRPTYRNFFPPDARWQFSGLRLAR
jgi:ergothioneine biosynthesis protein EgtB